MTARRAALVTGASYGVGAATALARGGFDVAVTARKRDNLAATVKTLGPMKRLGIALPAPGIRETALLQSGVLDIGFFRSTETADAPEGADKFVAFLLGSDGQNLLKEHGLTLQKMGVSGDASALPQDIKAIAGRVM